MARIRIEELPVVQTLTREEEESIFGAGRRTFRPMLESLENREMMDAGLGFGLQIPLAQPTGGVSQLALVRQLAGETMQQVNHVVGSALQTAHQVNHFVHSTLQTAQTAYSTAHHAVIDQIFAGLGNQNLPQGQQALSVQGDSGYVTQRAEQFLKDNIIEGSIWTNRWQLQPEKVSHKETKVEGNRITISFNVGYGISYGDQCTVNLVFEGKNTGGVKQYDLVGAGLDNWKGWDFVGKQFEPVAKELFRNKVGSIECQRFDETTFVNNAMRQAERICGVKEGTFVKNKVERIDGGIRILMYTDNNPFNPDWGFYKDWPPIHERPAGRGELWLTFKYDDSQLAKGSVKLSEIREGYWYQSREQLHGPFYRIRQNFWGENYWENTRYAGAHAHMRAAEWKVGP